MKAQDKIHEAFNASVTHSNVENEYRPPVKGVRSFYPPKKASYNEIAQNIHEQLRNYGTN